MLIIPYLYQSHNYIPIMSPCFRHIPMSSPFYAHQMALNPIDSPEFPKKAPSPVPQRAKRGAPGASVSGAMRTMNCRRSRTLILTPKRSPKCEVPHFLMGIEPYWTLLNRIEPEWTGVDLVHTIFELHPVPTTRARDALDIEKTHQYLAEDRADIW